MKRSLWIVAAVLIVAVAMPAFAGEKKAEKCTADPDECKAKYAAKLAAKPWLGVEMDKTDKSLFKITHVVEGSPAEKAGFKEGDVLLAMNGVKYTMDNKKEIKKAWSGVTPGSEATYVVKRGGEKMKLAATLGHVPEKLQHEMIAKHMQAAHSDVKMAAK